MGLAVLVCGLKLIFLQVQASRLWCAGGNRVDGAGSPGAPARGSQDASSTLQPIPASYSGAARGGEFIELA